MRMAYAIEAASRASSKDGVVTTVKPVPDTLRAHALDPRVRGRYPRRGLQPKECGGNGGAFSLRATRKPPTFDDGLYETESTVEEQLIARSMAIIASTVSRSPQRPYPRTPCSYPTPWRRLHDGRLCLAGASDACYCRALRLHGRLPQYRLAPECPFPGPVRDAWGTVLWVRGSRRGAWHRFGPYRAFRRLRGRFTCQRLCSIGHRALCWPDMGPGWCTTYSRCIPRLIGARRRSRVIIPGHSTSTISRR